ncbi:MAG: hypothetical protein AAB445_00660 [Patescibacteria group bacterium]
MYVLIAFGAGMLLTFLTSEYLGFNLMRYVSQLVRLSRNEGVDIEASSWLRSRKIRIRLVIQPPRGLVLQAPGARAKTATTETFSPDTKGKQYYYFPENVSKEMPVGIAFPEYVDLVFGNPPKLQLQLRVHRVLSPLAGIWEPAVVEDTTGYTREAFKSYWKKGYRNLYMNDYVPEKAIIGTVRPKNIFGKPHPIVAPHSGFVLQFGAQRYTRIAAQANTILIGSPESLGEVRNPKLPGTLIYPEGKDSPVGRVVDKDEVIAYVESLGHPEPITVPAIAIVLQQHVQHKAGVGFNDLLFTYAVLEPASSS